MNNIVTRREWATGEPISGFETAKHYILNNLSSLEVDEDGVTMYFVGEDGLAAGVVVLSAVQIRVAQWRVSIDRIRGAGPKGEG